MIWICLVQDRNNWQAHVGMVMKHQVPLSVENKKGSAQWSQL